MDKKLHTSLKVCASENKMTMHKFINDAITRHVENMEDIILEGIIEKYGADTILKKIRG
jgi:hypothetical protein